MDRRADVTKDDCSPVSIHAVGIVVQLQQIAAKKDPQAKKGDNFAAAVSECATEVPKSKSRSKSEPIDERANKFNCLVQCCCDSYAKTCIGQYMIIKQLGRYAAIIKQK